MKIKTYLKTFFDLTFPKLCFYCETKTINGLLCKKCFQKIKIPAGNLCRYCAKPIPGGKKCCKECLAKKHYYDRIIALTTYQEPIITLTSYFKYKSSPFLGNFLSEIMISHLKRSGFEPSNFDFVISVPLNPAKQKERGYNQASLLGKKIANYFEIPFKDDIIYEVKNKRTQAKLDKIKRQENVKKAFKVNESLTGKNIIIIDDIFTTGSTLNECCFQLKEKGAQEIVAVTLAKA